MNAVKNGCIHPTSTMRMKATDSSPSSPAVP